ncbi:50S ribosomal protein L6 [candidate division KSB1 bacterium 4484_87]|nr:MAG: 50S ribosomal protein L6 [candidate division KSB1 bacterium 4484_87]
MSRVGKKPIDVPDGVSVEIDQNLVKVSKGDKVLQTEVHPDIAVKYDAEKRQIEVVRPNDSRIFRSLHGLYRSLISNMVIGVTVGFTKRLEIVGVGYRAELKGRNLQLSLGFAHPILFKPPEGIEIKVETPTKFSVSGIEKQLVGQVAAKIRSFRPPEPYKGKGIRYEGEYVRRKVGKSAA